MSCAVDVNILLYASDAASPCHTAAQKFLETFTRGPDLIYLCWPTIMGYLRMATHPAIFRHPLTQREAMANIEALLRLSHVRALSEGIDFWNVYRGVTDKTPTRGNLVPDAHLAAMLRQHGIRRLATHDRDFRKFDGLDVFDPLEAV
ncbi:MAG: TA system VapC family ribonuclease toxin [Kiritimatiellia bacterium]